MSLSTPAVVQSLIQSRESQLGVLLFISILTSRAWVYALSGLKNKQITLWDKGVAYAKLEGRRARFLASFWLVIAFLLTSVVAKLMYELVIDLKVSGGSY